MSSGSASAADPRLAVRLYGSLWASRANGPGLRAVVWFQGCSLGCKGCFNPDSHDAHAGKSLAVATLADEVIARSTGLDGLTVSGGEPFQQPEALLALLQAIRRATPLSVLVFSGYRLAEIERQPLGRDLLGLIDVLVAGRYVAKLRRGRALIGSANQRVHFLSERHGTADLEDLPEAEVVIDAEGRVAVSGIAPPLLQPASQNPRCL